MSKKSARRSAALMSVAAMATTGLIATAGPAGAALTQGENDATNGVPAYFADSEGMAVQLCIDACAEVDEETGEVTTPTLEDAPYFVAAAEVGGATVEWSVGTAADEETAGAFVALNGLIVRGRDALQTGAQYRLQGPWGVHTFTADGATNTVIAETGGEAGVAANGPVEGFLRPLNLAAGADVLGDGHTFGRVTGSPTGFNRVTLTGPGLRASTNRFALLGQLRAETPMSALSTKSLKLGSISKATRSTANIALDSFGTADVNVSYTKAGANPGAFQVTDNCAGGDCNITVSYSPRANRNASAILTINDGGLAAPRRVVLNGVAHDTITPKLQSRTPAKGASSVRPSKSVKVKFSEAVRGINRSTFTLVDSSGKKVRASVNKRRGTYVLNPARALDRSARYTVKVNGGAKQIRDLAGNATRDMRWSFRTR